MSEQPVVTGDTSDGYHTFAELYDHRRALTAALMVSRPDLAWRSRHHHPSDGPMFEGGWFVVGMNLPTGQISYHYELANWDDFDGVPTLDHAPKWDGHVGDDTIRRLLAWAHESKIVEG
jgi:hypothetical protein